MEGHPHVLVVDERNGLVLKTKYLEGLTLEELSHHLTAMKTELDQAAKPKHIIALLREKGGKMPIWPLKPQLVNINNHPNCKSWIVVGRDFGFATKIANLAIKLFGLKKARFEATLERAYAYIDNHEQKSAA